MDINNSACKNAIISLFYLIPIIFFPNKSKAKKGKQNSKAKKQGTLRKYEITLLAYLHKEKWSWFETSTKESYQKLKYDGIKNNGL